MRHLTHTKPEAKQPNITDPEALDTFPTVADRLLLVLYSPHTAE